MTKYPYTFLILGRLAWIRDPDTGKWIHPADRSPEITYEIRAIDAATAAAGFIQDNPGYVPTRIFREIRQKPNINSFKGGQTCQENESYPGH